MSPMNESSTMAKILAHMANNKLKVAFETEFCQNMEPMAMGFLKPETSSDHPMGQETTSESRRLDCIYDDEPLGFEKDSTNFSVKMHAQDHLEEVDI